MTSEPILIELKNRCAWNIVREYGAIYNVQGKLLPLHRIALKHALAVVGLGFFNAELNSTQGEACFWHNEETGHGFVTKEDNVGNVGVFPLTVPDTRIYTSSYWEEK